MMTHPIYSYSLCIALPLMLFFGFYFLFAPTPEKAIFVNYLRSRRIMGGALLLLAPIMLCISSLKSVSGMSMRPS